ncbi:MAG TPA: ASCH domain-containing protein [Candidatus Kryptonia bacterium]|nr:ASCH domain-containing protein [Candidatus Kryptonia bacterium]
MKAITIKQPWAWAIIFAGKDIENRSWYLHYRGPLLIHAGAAYQANARLHEGNPSTRSPQLEFSAIIGVVDLVDVVQRSKVALISGRYGFVLRNPRAISPPIPCKGRLNLWTPTETQVRRVKALS